MSVLISSPYSSPHLLPGNSPQVSDSISLNFSLDKRPSSAPSIDEPSSKKTKFTDIRIDRIRNTRLVSFPIRESSAGIYATRAERPAAATAEFDYDLDLHPSTSHVDLRTELPSSQSEVYEHSNDHSWENVALQVGGLESQVRLGFRCFLDSFYAACGYTPVWNQKQQQPPQISQHLSRQDAVFESMDKLAEYRIDESNVAYLVGKSSLYKESQSYIHDLPIRVVGACMSKFSRGVNYARRDAYRLAWRFVTGLDSFDVDRQDERWLGTDGVTRDCDLADEEPIEFSKMDVFGRK
jgi:hypothetical protein